jgi:TonB family protein
MEGLLTFGLTNAATAALLALAAAAIARFSHRPALLYALWLVVLFRLLVPPLLAVDLMVPDFGRAATDTDTAVVAVSGGGVVLADSGLSIDPMGVIALIWVAGALVVIGFAVAQSVQLRQVLAASDAVPDSIANRVSDIGRKLGLRRTPTTVVVEDRVPPMLWAFLGSVRLILPTELLDRLDQDQTDTLIAHELAHLSRRDHWVRHLELAAIALFWGNPVVCWATRHVRRAQELCCDDRVARLLPHHRRAYADCLVETARFLSGRQIPLGSPARAMADVSQMKGRIQMIMTTNRGRDLNFTARVTAAVALLACLAITPVITATSDTPEELGRPISLQLKDADLHAVLATFSSITAVEILVEPGISGTVTATFDEVPWDTALFNIVEGQGLTWERTGDQIIVRRGDGGDLGEVRQEDGRPSTRLAGKLDGAEVFRYVPDGRISEPVAIEKVSPRYPPEARDEGITGFVVADTMIDEIGVVRDVVIQESPSDELSASAIEALEQWRFAPAMMDGEPVAVRYFVTIKFNLQ